MRSLLPWSWVVPQAVAALQPLNWSGNGVASLANLGTRMPMVRPWWVCSTAVSLWGLPTWTRFQLRPRYPCSLSNFWEFSLSLIGHRVTPFSLWNIWDSLFNEFKFFQKSEKCWFQTSSALWTANTPKARNHFRKWKGKQCRREKHRYFSTYFCLHVKYWSVGH